MIVSTPPLFARLIDDAAVFPPGSAPLADAVRGHVRHRGAWYAPMIGPLVLPASMISSGAVSRLTEPLPSLDVALIGDTGIAGLPAAAASAAAQGLVVSQVEAAVAKRGEDPQPGLASLLRVAAELPEVFIYAEVPLAWGAVAALDTLTMARGDGRRIAAKFRTGGLAAELFPTPLELAAMICACRDRELPFKLTAGLHRAIRHSDPDTGQVHHGFVNILAGCVAAADGAEAAGVAQVLAGTDPVPLVESLRARRSRSRPLWTGYGSCSVAEPVADLRSLGLLDDPAARP